MIRPFDIRDVGVLQRLHAHARPLATQMIVVGGIHPLREAMRSYVAGGRDPVLCLVEREGIEAFGMLRMLPDESSAEVARPRGAALLLAAPSPRDEDGAHLWMLLVQELTAGAALELRDHAHLAERRREVKGHLCARWASGGVAERGAHHIVADVHEGGIEAQILPVCGFVPMFQQELMKHVGRRDFVLNDEPVAGLRPVERNDAPLIRALHIRCAPRLTWAAESSLDALLGVMNVQRGFVLVRSNEVVGHIGFWHGRRGRAMQCLFRPEYEEIAGAVLRRVLGTVHYRRSTYCCVRSYQSWLAPVLTELGFVHVSSNQVMMRHSAPRVQAPVWSVALRGRRLLATDD